MTTHGEPASRHRSAAQYRTAAAFASSQRCEFPQVPQHPDRETRKQTFVLIRFLLAMSAAAAIFFFLVEQIISFAIRLILGLGV